MLIHPYRYTLSIPAWQRSRETTDLYTYPRQPRNTLQVAQAISGCIVVALAIDRYVINNSLIKSFLWGTLGFGAGILVKKVISLYTLFSQIDQFMLETSERYPYAYRAAMAISLIACLIFPNVGNKLVFSLSLLPGYFYDVQMF